MERLTLKSTKCPYCGANLIGDPIPEKDRESFGNHTHFQRQIAIVINDRVTFVKCPDCGKEDPREFGRKETS